jgi:hypothetical protein
LRPEFRAEPQRKTSLSWRCLSRSSRSGRRSNEGRLDGAKVSAWPARCPNLHRGQNYQDTNALRGPASSFGLSPVP